MSTHFESRQAAAAAGMSVAWTAGEASERPAVISLLGSRSFGELNRRANQLARSIRAQGVSKGDSIALFCGNRPEFAEVWCSAQRSGLRLTCINFHLQADEVAYIVANCEARVLVADARFAEVAAGAAAASPKLALRLAIGGEIAGFRDYDSALAGQDALDLDDPVLGGTMLYTSGTTGRPKGVYRRRPPVATRGLGPEVVRTSDFRPGEDLCLCTGPLYHAAPLAFNLALPLNQGIGTVLMDGWDALETLRLIEAHRCTHTHMVATMFHRLLALPREMRERFDLESMRFVLHGAAPTPVDVKRGLIDWLGPIVYEYYAATEGGGTYIDSHEWLRKPGSVGRPSSGVELEVRGEDGESLGPDQVGTVYFRAPEVGRFEYFKDTEKTASAYSGDWFTLRDMGYLDRDSYLFLTGRTAELIISGGVNIYPAEVDAILLGHPAVRDVATIGVPSGEWGEEVKAVVQLADGFEAGEGIADALIQHCRERLAHYKCPRTVDFALDLPRADTGKIYRRRVREPYWQGRTKSI